MSHRASAEFVYRLPGRSVSSRPGAHNSSSRGAGMNFISHARLMDQPDPRRLDLRASISSIQKEWLVRINQQRSAITVSVIVDVSPSMHFGVNQSKLQVAAAFLQALGLSAGSLGDAVGLSAFDQLPREDLSMPIRQARGIGYTMADVIRHCEPSSGAGMANSAALSYCLEMAASRASLVFLLSDFHWPLDELHSLFDPLAGTMVVPLVIWDRSEVEPPTGARLLSVRQMGAGASRHLWMTDKVRQQWRDKVALREQEITELFARRDISPFFMRDGFDPEALSRYFMESTV